MERTCAYCDKPPYKTNGKAEAICYNRAFTGRCEGNKPRVVKPQQGRNEKCNCGSGLKYKNCCWRILVETI